MLMCIPEIQMEESLTQIVDIGVNFDFIKCRNLY